MIAQYIAEQIQKTLPYNDPQALIDAIGKVRLLNEAERKIEITDLHGKRYVIKIIEMGVSHG